MKIREITGLALMLLGSIPGLVWAGYAVYMLYIGPRIGWISEEFVDIEGTSLLWCGGMFAGIGLMVVGDAIRLARKDGKL